MIIGAEWEVLEIGDDPLQGLGTSLHRFQAAGERTIYGQRRVERRCTFEATIGKLNDES